MLASALCKAAGRQVPIFAGAEEPFAVPQQQTRAQQAEALHRWDHDPAEAFPPGHAVEFLRRTIRAHPGEVMLLTIGPLTNTGRLFTIDPTIPSLLKGLVMMCGNFTERRDDARPEWNESLDPHAAAIVYRAAVPVHRSIGVNVTARVTMPAQEVRRRFQSPLLRPVAAFAEVWFREEDRITFHDPLAAATIFDERVCRFERSAVEVEVEDETRRGATYWRPHEAGPHEIAVDVDSERFFSHYFSIVGAAGRR